MLLTSCTRYYCQPTKGSRDYARMIQTKRTIQGKWKTTFVLDSGDTVYLNLDRKPKDSCYLIPKG
jgi:hypothetical protein